jgi:hypothetical protein
MPKIAKPFQMVTETVWRVLDTTQAAQNGIVDVGTLKREYPQRFGSTDFLLPEFKTINDAAYWIINEVESMFARTTVLQRHTAISLSQRIKFVPIRLCMSKNLDPTVVLTAKAL